MQFTFLMIQIFQMNVFYGYPCMNFVLVVTSLAPVKVSGWC